MTAILRLLGRPARGRSSDVSAGQSREAAEAAARLRKDERDAAVLSGQLPPGAEELIHSTEYYLSTWTTGPGR